MKLLMSVTLCGVGGFCLLCEAVHPCDKAGDPPTANIGATANVITVNGVKVTGTEVNITLSTTPADQDVHKDSQSGAESAQPDTFDNPHAILWHAIGINGTFDNPELKQTTFLTPVSPVNGTITLDIRDDGTHFQDFAVRTKVAEMALHVVNPDGARIKSQPTPTYDATTGRFQTPVTIQVTYQNLDLPWKGYLAERYKSSSYFCDTHDLPYLFNDDGAWQWNGNWSTAGSYSNKTEESGCLIDVHDGTELGLQEGKYYDMSGTHVVGRALTGGSAVSLQSFKNKFYLKHEVGQQVSGVHDEQP